MSQTLVDQRIEIPKKIVYSARRSIPMRSSDYPDNDPSVLPIVPVNSLLGSLQILSKSRECESCGRTVFPKPSKNFHVPEICPYCKYDSKKRTLPVERKNDLKRSSTLQRLDAFLQEAFKKYYEHSDFREKENYTENWIHLRNHEIYMTDTIIQDASEIVSYIESLIAFDSFPIRYFMRNGESYDRMFQKIIDNEGVLKLKPYFDLLTMASSVVKAKQMTIIPMIRGSRMGPANITNVETQSMKG